MEQQSQTLKDELDHLTKLFPSLQFSFVFQIAFCHLCKQKAVVFSCYKGSKALSCTKKYCGACLASAPYGLNMIDVLRTQREWSCPNKLNACICKNCHQSNLADATKAYTPKTPAPPMPEMKRSAAKKDFDDEFNDAYESLFVQFSEDSDSEMTYSPPA